MLSPDAAVEQVRQMIRYRDAERPRLNRIHDYLTATNDHVWLTSSVPTEVRRLADISRVPVSRLVVDSVVQSLYVDGFRQPKAAEDVPAWDLWQRNRMDSRQMGVHRAASAYGAAYVSVLPGDPVPVVRGHSPRNMTTVYGPEVDWPMWALERRDGKLWRLFDNEASYWVGEESSDIPGTPGRMTFIQSELHGATSGGQPVTPVVRFVDTEDLDVEVRGEVEPLIPVQDQINMTTFGLLVAQHYGAFRQRYIIGWLAESETEKMQASASQLWTFEDHPDEVKIGEFGQTDLKGYIESREASLRHLAIISQTPVSELTAQLINLSADALVEARASHHRKIDERKTVRGESWEQALSLGGEYQGRPTDPSAYVRWRDTEARALGQTVDALGKMVQMLNIPPQALWERAAESLGVPQQELEEWKRLADLGDPLARLQETLAGQVA